MSKYVQKKPSGTLRGHVGVWGMVVGLGVGAYLVLHLLGLFSVSGLVAAIAVVVAVIAVVALIGRQRLRKQESRNRGSY